MGNAVDGGAGGANNGGLGEALASKEWWLTNVLFLNGDGSGQGGKGIRRGQYGSRDSSRSGDGRMRRCRLAVPNALKMNLRSFPITLKIEDFVYDNFLLQCSVDPAAVLIKDHEQRVLRSIPYSIVRTARRKAEKVALFLLASDDGARSSSLRVNFEFRNVADADSFVEHLELLYGTYVETVGVTRAAEAKKSSPVLADRGGGSGGAAAAAGRQDSDGCPLHGSLPCSCRSGGSRGSPPDSSAPTGGADDAVVIKGVLEPGQVLRCSGAERKKGGIDIVEWRAALLPGGASPFFKSSSRRGAAAAAAVVLSDTYTVRERDVGRCIQVTVMRTGTSGAVVVSRAVAGPVTLSQRQAETLFAKLAAPAATARVETTGSVAASLFPFESDLVKRLNEVAPFIRMDLTRTPGSLALGLVDAPENVEQYVLPVECFWPEPPATDEAAGVVDVASEKLKLLVKGEDDPRPVPLEFYFSSDEETALFYQVLVYDKLTSIATTRLNMGAKDTVVRSAQALKVLLARLWTKLDFLASVEQDLAPLEGFSPVALGLQGGGRESRFFGRRESDESSESSSESRQSGYSSDEAPTTAFGSRDASGGLTALTSGDSRSIAVLASLHHER